MQLFPSHTAVQAVPHTAVLRIAIGKFLLLAGKEALYCEVMCPSAPNVYTPGCYQEILLVLRDLQITQD